MSDMIPVREALLHTGHKTAGALRSFVCRFRRRNPGIPLVTGYGSISLCDLVRAMKVEGML